MDLDWWVERFGAMGIMLAGLLWDRTRLLADIRDRDARINDLTDKLIDQSTAGLAESIRREQQTLSQLETIAQGMRGVAR